MGDNTKSMMLKIPSYDAMRQAVVVGLCLACQVAPAFDPW
jgi:hypothetical protein